MLNAPAGSQTRVMEWIDQTTYSATTLQSPLTSSTRQRRQALRPSASRPRRSTESRPLSTSPPRPIDNFPPDSVAQTTADTHGDDDIFGYTPGPPHLTAYPATILMIMCFLCAVLLPSFIILLVFAGFLTAGPRYESIQVPQWLPLHLEQAVISLDSDEEVSDMDGEESRPMKAELVSSGTRTPRAY